ncbi:hypothetical protein FOZ63_011946 [Perkinsus olseni]|uniref:Uncharacterized protein n=1 Tax=Perkinsus olseni TaxID=32597 RepID=A0A7J6PZV4_PEROL|nr:hypothetical protein FOZ63_011946 [Perkinsus olseni]
MPETEKSLSIDHESGSPVIEEEAPSESFHTPLAVSSSNKENDLDEDNADRTRLSGLSELTLTPDESPPTHPRSPPPAPAQSRRSLPGGINLKLAFDPPPRKKGPPPLPSYARKTTFISFNQFDSGLSREECLAATSENPPSVAMYSSSSSSTDTPVIISNDTTVCNVEDDQDEIAESLGWLRTIHNTLCNKFEKGLAEEKHLPRPSDETDLLKATARLLLADCQSSILSSPSPYAAVVRFLGKVPLGVSLPGAPPDDPPPDDDTN